MLGVGVGVGGEGHGRALLLRMAGEMFYEYVDARYVEYLLCRKSNIEISRTIRRRCGCGF